MFSAGIWAFHFGYDNNAYPSMERAAQFINNSGQLKTQHIIHEVSAIRTIH